MSLIPVSQNNHLTRTARLTDKVLDFPSERKLSQPTAEEKKTIDSSPSKYSQKTMENLNKSRD